MLFMSTDKTAPQHGELPHPLPDPSGGRRIGRASSFAMQLEDLNKMRRNRLDPREALNRRSHERR
jgi:hypothetical protein